MKGNNSWWRSYLWEKALEEEDWWKLEALDSAGSFLGFLWNT